MNNRFVHLFLLIALLWTIGVHQGCKKTEKVANRNDSISMIASTSMIADWLHSITKDSIEIITLIPIGVDPHFFVLSPKDRIAISKADLIVLNGCGLESDFLETIREGVDATKLISLGDSLFKHPSLKNNDSEHLHNDPHFWFDVSIVVRFVPILVDRLVSLSPQNEMYFRENAKQFLDSLIILDRWIQAQIQTIPDENRKLISDHFQFGYFARRYGLREVGAILPSVHTHASPSMNELGKLSELVKQERIRTLFTDEQQSNSLLEQFASDNQLTVVKLRVRSIGIIGSETENYFMYMRWNTQQIVKALKDR